MLTFYFWNHLIELCIRFDILLLITDFWDAFIFIFQLNDEGPGEELSGDDMLSSFNEWVLPAREFDGMWERSGILKKFLLWYLFSYLYF